MSLAFRPIAIWQRSSAGRLWSAAAVDFPVGLPVGLLGFVKARRRESPLGVLCGGIFWYDVSKHDGVGCLCSARLALSVS